MKTKLTSAVYLGYTVMDRRLSKTMLPWVLKEIRLNGIKDKLSIGIEEGYLKAYNENFEPVIVHRLLDIIRTCPVPGIPEEFFYILMNEKEELLNCYLFRTNSVHEVSDLFGQMREPSPGAPGQSPLGSSNSISNGSVTKNVSFQRETSTEHLPWNRGPSISLPKNCHLNLAGENSSQLVRTTSNASVLTSLSNDLSPSDSHFFEVLYIGKVKISQRKVPDSLIDDALNKFAQHEAEKAKLNQIRRNSLLSSQATSLSCDNSTENIAQDVNKEKKITISGTSTTPLEPDKQLTWKSAENLHSAEIHETKKIDDEFDLFTKERAEKTGSGLRKPTPVPLEPTVLILNVPKNNLTTLAEDDDEKQDDLHSILSDTASSITQFCQENFLKDLSPTKENIEKIPFRNDVQKIRDPLINVPIKEDRLKVIKKIREDSPAPNYNFDEINPKPNELIRRNTGLESVQSNTLPENKPFLRDRSASIGTINMKTPIAQVIGEQNRTMLFQIGRSELRLISPDRKQILLHRPFRDIASCVIGRHHKDHFGFVCRETNNEAYACYVFKCESDSVALEVVNAIKQAFLAHTELIKKSREKSPNMTCEHCPMLWYHRLCYDIEGMNEKKIHAFILRRIEQLPEEEQEQIITKYQGGTNHMYEVNEHNAFLMMLLRAHCETKQQRHVHDTAENRSEFLNQYLGGNTIFMKAKRSLSSGFDHLLKRKASRDESAVITPHPLPLKKDAVVQENVEPINDGHLSPEVITRSKSLSPGPPAVNERSEHSPSPILQNNQNSSSNPQEVESESKKSVSESPMMDIFLKVSDSRSSEPNAVSGEKATWRQAIYRRVVEPGDVNCEDELSPKNLLNLQPQQEVSGKRSKEDLRRLWRMAIEQTVLLVRMEKENAKLKESEESSAVRRIKLEYTDLGTCDAGVTLMWDSLLSTRDSSNQVAKVDRHMLTQAVMQGVPRMSRGGVWYFLAEQACIRLPPPDVKKFPLYNTPYHTLLAGLTKHQHAILIDLGRTFPQHSYFASALGPGQLALYNILKAYSLLDPDVGYCQGLSFVAGVLLLHMEEAEAFVLLRHLMFRRGLRKQYLPDMSALQVQLYQLSRLLRDHEPELHQKLELLDISPALYAAPWMLTLFTSQFPLGFVVKVFDFIFLRSLDVVFAFSLALLSVHKDGILLCDCCEEAAEYLKHKLPDINKKTFNKVMQKVHSLDISRQLADYAVEYAVLCEEMPRITLLTATNQSLAKENRRMAYELDSAMDAITNCQTSQSRYEYQLRSLEQQVMILSRYIANHQDRRQELPQEIKKIVQLHNKKATFGSKITNLSSKFTLNEEEDETKLKTGLSSPNLFSKITKEDIMNAANKEKDIEDKRAQFLMKKSQSVNSGLMSANLRQYPLKVLDERNEHKRSESFRQDDIIMESLKALGKKNSGFFASTHEQIRQERLFEQKLKRDFDDNLKRLDEKLTNRSDISLNLKEFDEKNDSGFVTPSPDKNDERKDDNVSVISHPLSDCDVDIKFDGQSTKLKCKRPVVKHNLETDAKQVT